ncbi:cache domain-containing protein [Campylobacter corcagiensis]|uniref:Double Cache domain-containing protein n=1 Tax=Campylobacter corcagiensis TaxID=1448857 RepID=A0A7M1LG58_9BACT|nr:cache domain-containing protein [Campylobacter corcagiensis]QKF64533.1 Cache sensor-containing signal transduction protein [Campylobacter corcagiensis]QOQ87291.1 hypothetical protein IMC76_00225 [Campylobacter corcagiensis]
MSHKFLKTIFFIATASLVLYFLIGYLNSKNIDESKDFLDSSAKVLLNSAKEDRLNALAMSTLISHNKALKECMSSKNLDDCKNILNNHVNTLKEIPLYKNVKIHLHSNDILSLVRSWDSNLTGDDLSSFRHSLKMVKNSKKPISGIEIGRCGVYTRGISPIIKDEEFLGSVEVMLDFSYLNESMKKSGVNLFILIPKRFKTDCFSDKLSLVKGYILLNEMNVDLNFVNMLNEIDLNKSYTKIGSNHFYSMKFFDLNEEFIGYIILHINYPILSSSNSL